LSSDPDATAPNNQGTESNARAALDTDRHPYVSTVINGRIYFLNLSRAERNRITTTTRVREIVKTVLQHYYSIPQMRELTLNGRGQRNELRPIVALHVVQLALGKFYCIIV